MRCPDCGADLPAGPVPRCPACELPLSGPAAYELWQVDRALAGLRDQVERLQARRGELIGLLRSGGAQASPPPGGQPVSGARPFPVHQPFPGGRPVPGGQPVPGGRPVPGQPVPGASPYGAGASEVSGRAARNVLLVLGGLLLTIAAIVFTVVSWGRLGTGGRAAVLAGFTLLVMLAPVLLVRRRLTATAETVAGFGVVLLLLDGYAARRAGLLSGVASEPYTAGVLALTAIILVLYARLTRLRGPAPVAVVLAQPVLLLLVLDMEWAWPVTALVVTAALDAVLVHRARGAVRVTGAVCGAGTGVLALLSGAPYALLAPELGDALMRVLPMVLLALLGGALTWWLGRRAATRGWAAVAVVGTALALVTVVAAPSVHVVGDAWEALAYLVPAVAVALGSTWLPWRAVRVAGAATGWSVAFLVTLTTAPRVVATLAIPLAWVDVLWTGVWTGRDWRPYETATPADVALTITVTVALLLAALRAGTALRLPGAAGPPAGGDVLSWAARVALGAALVSGVLAVALMPQAFALPYAIAVALQAVPVVAVALTAVFARTPWWVVTCAVVAGAASLRAAAYAFGSEPATLVVLPVLAVVAAAMAVRAGVKGLRPFGLGFAVAFLGLEAMAAGFSLGMRPLVAASAGCAVAGVVLLVKALPAGPAGLRYAGSGLLVLATWLRLGADEVSVVEAYTVPCSLVLLWFGVRRGREVPSWVSYGPGLAFTMLPSLVAVYADADWWRSPALGVLGLGVLLAGVRARLQAPTVLGAVVVAGVGVHELAPYVSDLLSAVPRWAPIAVGGLLLVAVGATYEARLRDLRRLRAGLTAMK